MSLEPYALRVDGQSAPQGVIAAPTFSWRLRSDRRGARQTAYRITVVLRLPGGDTARVWDSGRIGSDLTVGARYAGAPLMSSADYEWTLETEDERGETTVRAARFATGIVHPDEWDAAWIARNPNFRRTALPPQDTDISFTVNKLQPVRRFVHHFELDDVPAVAKVHVSAKGAYRLYVNGRKVGDDELAPGWTEYRDRITYQSWDVSGMLRPGRNSLAALLGDGWYAGFIGTDRRHQAQHYGTEPALLAQLMLDGADGGRTVVGTGEGWKESASDILYADMLMGQYEDSRVAQPDWHLPECDLDDWSDAIVLDRDIRLLTPEVDPGVRVTGRLPAVSVTARGNGRHIVDFGQNLVGRVRLTLRDQPADRRIQLDHAEVLDEGDLYTANLRTAEPVDVFWTNGDAEQVFEPRFTLHGFRFAEVQGIDGDLDPADIEAVVLHNAFDVVGEFSSSSPELDRLFQNISWGLRGNFVSIPTDCPQRDERLGWLADAQVFAPTALAIADVGPLLRRWLRDVRSAQNADGAFPDIAPHLIHLREGAPAWGDGGVTIPWSVYRATGDRAVLEEAADSMIAWVRHIERHNPDLIWREQVGNDYGDWLQIGEETRKDVLATAYFAHSADLTARTLRVLGRDAEAEPLEALRERIAAVFREAFVQPDGTVAGDTQGGYLLALAFGLTADTAERDRVADRLVEAVLRRDVSLTTGFVTVGLLCPVLASIGREDLAFRLLHNDRYPSWLFSVKNGATTIWERWDGWTPEAGFQSARMNSFNHYSLGSVGAWFVSGILGIGQAEASSGYFDLVLAPRLDPFLDHAEGALETPRGRVASSWRRHADHIEWAVTVPPGSPAVVELPCPEASDITEGGENATHANGVTLMDRTSRGTRLRLEPGTFTFRFPAG
ncbi:family 78 glycoside hydrolase catalytic domain [Agromyces silvae]|uniref:family 78 glycoside hydrolase catalytic domain n=1 Tax=Agromyces silvae TaxID=3388266 RepID=UPI00280A8D1B|nr:family 78 glycoside hydrolase catalytic domain [Agromyces protaetiae]